MKRLMYVAGYFFAMTWLAGVFFKLMNLPGAEVLLFGGGGLAFIFFAMMLLNSYKKIAKSVLTEKLKWFFGIATLLLFAVTSWMEFAHIKGAGVMMAISFLNFGFGFLPFLYFRMYRKSKDTLRAPH